MNLLALIQTFTRRMGIPVPTEVVTSTDKQVIQILGLLGEVLEDLAADPTWSALVLEATFTTVAAQDQGALATLAPTGFKRVLNDTLYDRSRQLPIFGPVNNSQWQALQALPTSGPFYKYRITRGHLYFDPAPEAGASIAFEYVSNYVVLDVDGVTYKQYPDADTDTFVLDTALLIAGLRWKWKYEKGLDYAEDFRRFEELKLLEKSADGTKGVLSMDNECRGPQPGIFVPGGNWTVS